MITLCNSGLKFFQNIFLIVVYRKIGKTKYLNASKCIHVGTLNEMKNLYDKKL